MDFYSYFSNLSLLSKVLLPILGFVLLLGFQMGNDMLLPKDDLKPKSWLRRLTKRGRNFILVSVIVFIVTEVGIIFDNKTNPRIVAESRPDDSLKKGKDTIIVKEKSVIEQRHIDKLPEPILDLIPPILIQEVYPDIKENPSLVVTYRADTVFCDYTFYIYCLNQGVVTHTKDTRIIFEIKNGLAIPTTFTAPRTLPENHILYNDNNINHGTRLMGQFIVGKYSKLPDSTYLYLKLEYSNKLTGKKDSPLRKVFNIKSFPSNEGKTFKIQDAKFDEYKIAEKALTKIHRW